MEKVTGTAAAPESGQKKCAERGSTGWSALTEAMQIFGPAFLLIDARNTFNEENRTGILWAVRNEWPCGAQFTFNCYRH